MRLIFINRFFYPDHSATSQLLSDVAFGLVERGAAVSVITSRLLYDSPEIALHAREKINGVDVHRIWTTRFGRNILALRALDYASFYLALAWTLFRLAKSGDFIIAKTDPPMLSVIARPIAAWRGARLVNRASNGRCLLMPGAAQV